jgi:hypothetical protein
LLSAFQLDIDFHYPSVMPPLLIISHYFAMRLRAAQRLLPFSRLLPDYFF